MRISDWSSDVCSSDLRKRRVRGRAAPLLVGRRPHHERQRPTLRQRLVRQERPRVRLAVQCYRLDIDILRPVILRLDRQRLAVGHRQRSEEHTSELQSLMRISYAVFCLKKKKKT